MACPAVIAAPLGWAVADGEPGAWLASPQTDVPAARRPDRAVRVVFTATMGDRVS